jgi:hypothetical protein
MFINNLDPVDELVLKSVMRRLKKRVQERRIDAWTYMEDYDFVKEGSILLKKGPSRPINSDLC